MVSFDKEVLQASYDKPVLVDFWAAWCGPCRMLGPTLEQLAEEQSDKWTLVKVNTEGAFSRISDHEHSCREIISQGRSDR